MINDDFGVWARENGIDSDAVDVILECAATPLEAKTVRTDCIYAPDDIKDLHETDGFGVAPRQSGFIFVGYCANGDPIALDVAHDRGSVWYISHEDMHSSPLRTVAVRVADNLGQAYRSIVSDREFPTDYYSAKKKIG